MLQIGGLNTLTALAGRALKVLTTKRKQAIFLFDKKMKGCAPSTLSISCVPNHKHAQRHRERKELTTNASLFLLCV